MIITINSNIVTTVTTRWYMNLAGTELPLMTNKEMVERMTSSGEELVTINIHHYAHYHCRHHHASLPIL